MTGQEVPQEITARLTADALIKSSLKSIIWFGSVRNNQDVHERSDCDLQVVLDEPSYELTVAVNTILEDYPSVDLSICICKTYTIIRAMSYSMMAQKASSLCMCSLSEKSCMAIMSTQV